MRRLQTWPGAEHPVITAPEECLPDFGDYPVPERCRDCPVAQIISGLRQEGQYAERQPLPGGMQAELTLRLSPDQRLALDGLATHCDGRTRGTRSWLRTIVNQARESLAHAGPVTDFDTGATYAEKTFIVEDGCPVSPRNVDRVLGEYVKIGMGPQFSDSRVVGFRFWNPVRKPSSTGSIKTN